MQKEIFFLQIYQHFKHSKGELNVKVSTQALQIASLACISQEIQFKSCWKWKQVKFQDQTTQNIKIWLKKREHIYNYPQWRIWIQKIDDIESTH